MSNAFTRALSTPVPQGEPENALQVKNSAGGYTFTVDDKTRLERFLILGTNGGTYYAKERDLTTQNLDFVKDLISRDFELVARTVAEVSAHGRAPSNSPALMVAALLLTAGSYPGLARKTALSVARTSTHLFELASYI